MGEGQIHFQGADMTARSSSSEDSEDKAFLCAGFLGDQKASLEFLIPLGYVQRPADMNLGT